MRLFPVWGPTILLAPLLLHAQAPPAAPPKETSANTAKGMPPRANSTDYQARTQAGAVTIAAEFAGHSVPRPQGPLSTEEFVVVETALYGAPDAKVTLSPDNFSLRINGKKGALPSQPYGMVVRSVKDPEWAPPKPPEKSKSSIGTGGGGDSNLPPPVVHVPIELQRAMANDVHMAALPEGEHTLPQAGLLFFQYRGKTQSIHSLELIYNGPAGKATLSLQP